MPLVNNPFVAKNGLIAAANLIFASGVSVGINKGNPSSTLDVNGTFAVSGASALVGNVSISGVLSITSNANFNSGVLFIDATNSRIGIGNVAPPFSLTVSATDGALLPAGNTAQRPGSPANGVIRYNSEITNFEAYIGGVWKNFNIGTVANTYAPAGAVNSLQFNNAGVFGNAAAFAVGANVGIGNTTPDAKLAVTGTANVSGAVSFGSTLNVSGTITAQNTVGVTGAVTLANTLAVTGAATFSNTVVITNAATLSNTLNVVGGANLQSTMNVGATLGVNGVATFANSIVVTGDANLNAGLNLAGTAIIGGNTLISNAITVTGLANLASGFDVAGRTEFANNFASNMKIKSYKEATANSIISTNSYAIDCSISNVFDLTLANSSITFSLINVPPAGTQYSCTLWLHQDATGGRVPTFANAIKWSGGSNPTFATLGNQLDIVSLMTINGGLTAQGIIVAANSAA